MAWVYDKKVGLGLVSLQEEVLKTMMNMERQLFFRRTESESLRTMYHERVREGNDDTRVLDDLTRSHLELGREGVATMNGAVPGVSASQRGAGRWTTPVGLRDAVSPAWPEESWEESRTGFVSETTRKRWDQGVAEMEAILVPWKCCSGIREKLLAADRALWVDGSFDGDRAGSCVVNPWVWRSSEEGLAGERTSICGKGGGVGSGRCLAVGCGGSETG